MLWILLVKKICGTTQMARAVNIVVQLLQREMVNGGVACTFCGNRFVQILNLIVFTQQTVAEIQRKGKLYHWSVPRPYGFVCGKYTSFSATVRMDACALRCAPTRSPWSKAYGCARVFVVHLALNLNAKTRIYTFALGSMHANVSKTKPQTRNEKKKKTHIRIYSHLRCGFHLNLRSKYHEIDNEKEWESSCGIASDYMCSGRTRLTHASTANVSWIKLIFVIDFFFSFSKSIQTLPCCSLKCKIQKPLK